MDVAMDAAMNKGFQPQLRLLRTLQPPSTARNIAGLAIVVALHLAVVLGALYGLNRNGVRIIPPAALEWVSIVTPTPPAPPPVRVELPKVTTPPVQVSMTPPDVVLDQPPQSSDAISVPTSNAAAGSVSSMNTNADAVAPSAGLASACPNAQVIRSTMRYPALARRDGLEGQVLARFIVGAGGGIRNIEIVTSANRAFNSAVVDAVKQFRCVGQVQDVTVEVPFIFHLE